jgi:hypothetical protein
MPDLCADGTPAIAPRWQLEPISGHEEGRGAAEESIMSKQWFDVDKIGLSKQAEQQGKGRLVGKLVQNALDEPGITQIAVTLALVPGRPQSTHR